MVDAGRMAGTDDLDTTCTHLVLDPVASATKGYSLRALAAIARGSEQCLVVEPRWVWACLTTGTLADAEAMCGLPRPTTSVSQRIHRFGGACGSGSGSDSQMVLGLVESEEEEEYWQSVEQNQQHQQHQRHQRRYQQQHYRHQQQHRGGLRPPPKQPSVYQLRRLIELAGGRVAPHNADCADESVTVCLAWGQPSAARMHECSQRGHLVVRPDFVFLAIDRRADWRPLLGELQNDPTYMWSS